MEWTAGATCCRFMAETHKTGCHWIGFHFLLDTSSCIGETVLAQRKGITAVKIPYQQYTDAEKTAHQGIRLLAHIAHSTAMSSGWYTDPLSGKTVQRDFGTTIALMHSELSEALEAHRKGLMDEKLPHRNGIEVEFADCIIRILDTAEAMGLDVAGAIIEKNRFNRTREDHRLENRAKQHGKAY